MHKRVRFFARFLMVWFFLLLIAGTGAVVENLPMGVALANPNKCPPGAANCVCACKDGNCMWKPAQGLNKEWREAPDSSCEAEIPVVLPTSLIRTALPRPTDPPPVPKERTPTLWVFVPSPTPDRMGDPPKTPTPTATLTGVVPDTGATCDLCVVEQSKAESLKRIADTLDRLFGWLTR